MRNKPQKRNRAWLRTRGLTADDPRKPPRKQYVFLVEGRGVGVTFTRAEETRVLKKAERLGVSVEELLARSIGKRVRTEATRPRPVGMTEKEYEAQVYDRVDELILRVIHTIGKPSKTKTKAVD